MFSSGGFLSLPHFAERESRFDRFCLLKIISWICFFLRCISRFHEIFSSILVYSTTYTTKQVLQCGNFGNSLSHIFDKNFMKTTFLLRKLLKRWFDEIFFRFEWIFHFITLSQSGNYGNLLSGFFWQKFRKSNVFAK